VTQPPNALPQMCYQVLFYKNNGSFAVRETSGRKTQVFSYGGKTVAKRRPDLTKDALESIGEKVVEKLDRGEWSVEEGKAWCLSQLK
jgi:hypothetical protein